MTSTPSEKALRTRLWLGSTAASISSLPLGENLRFWVTASRRSYLDSPRLTYPAVELIIFQDVLYDSGAMTSKERIGLLLALISVDVLFGSRMLNLSILR
jgi:hypothetical protein